MPSPSQVFKLSVPGLILVIVVTVLYSIEVGSLYTVGQRVSEIKLWESKAEDSYICGDYGRGTAQQGLGHVGRRDCSMCAVASDLCDRVG
jgi:hypothetical protein